MITFLSFVLQGQVRHFRQSDLSTPCSKGLIDGPIKSALPRDITQMAPHLCLKRRLASEVGWGQLSCHGDQNGDADLS